MKKLFLIAMLVGATSLMTACGCGFSSGCCPDTTTTSCCGSSGW